MTAQPDSAGGEHRGNTADQKLDDVLTRIVGSTTLFVKGNEKHGIHTEIYIQQVKDMFKALEQAAYNRGVTAALKVAPRKADMLDVGEMGGPNGDAGYSAPAVTYVKGYNSGLSDYTTNIKKLLEQQS